MVGKWAVLILLQAYQNMPATNLLERTFHEKASIMLTFSVKGMVTPLPFIGSVNIGLLSGAGDRTFSFYSELHKLEILRKLQKLPCGLDGPKERLPPS
ncbi:hypothetical protein ACRRTK_014500 [Alexandromys fortis]